MKVLYPLTFSPVYKDYLWGGDRIIRHYHRDLPEGIYAESWEVSAHPDGMSVVRAGPLAGKTLAELTEAYGEALLGSRVGRGPFPLLFKVLDAAQRLSVQVHPNDETAARYGGEPKTEMWYLLDADEGAAVFAGLQPGTDAERFKEAIETCAFEDVLKRVPVRAGDAVFIPGGRVHAIDSGCLILEVQQTSNTTYRIYDWGRVDANGKGRELHIEQAAQVTMWDDTEDARVTPRRLDTNKAGERWFIYQSPYFRMERWQVGGDWRETGTPESFQVVFNSEGTTRLSWDAGELTLVPGTSCLIPASLPGYRLTPEGESTVLRVTVP